MVSMTDQAAAVLKETMQASGVPPGNALRLQAGPQGFSLAVDSPNDNDQILPNQSEPVLLVDPEVDQQLGQAVIEIQDGAEGESPQLVIRHPEG